MNIFLFLYPIGEFFDFCIKNYEDIFMEKGYSVKRFDEIIQKRYRERGFQIYWLMFEKDGRFNRPNTTEISNVVTVATSDHIITTDISFEYHIASKTYPDPEHILRQLPTPISQLIIGGFHRQDCVDKMAAYAYEKDISVFIDEDVTDFFFINTHIFGEVPLQKDIFEPIDFRKAPGFSEKLVKFAREHRRRRPWLAQVKE